VQILAAEQTFQSDDWYQGTADAVRKQLFEIKATGADDVLILSGDHLYRMDYVPMMEYHWQTGADITVATQPVPKEEAARLGILKRGTDGRITAFVEKPKDPKVLAQFVSRDDEKKPFLASMGIYVFKTQVLIDLLNNHPDFDEFGGDVIPYAISTMPVFGFDFEGYWVDVGTIRSFYETNLELTDPTPPFNFYDPRRPIYTHARYLPGSIVEDSRLKDVLLAEGCLIRRAEITRCVLGTRTRVGRGSVIKDSILMGSDYYERRSKDVPLGIGKNCHIEGAILDKNVHIGNDVVIKSFPRGTDIDAGSWVVQDGIVVIPKDTVIPDGTHIEPEA
jgi:glucose-1-phosphate adenylyltransferase